VRSYFQPSADLSGKTRLLVERVSALDFVVAESTSEALILEFNLIQKHRPRFNVRYRDDKSYPYIRIDMRERFPMLCVVRQSAVLPDGAKYFGPFASAKAMWETIRLVRRVFGLCQRQVVSAKRRGGCSWRPERGPRLRPCLDYFMERCLGPCAGKVTAEEYRRAARHACDLLAGRYERVRARLATEMEAAAGREEFELAARLRDQVQALDETLGGQRVVSRQREDVDVLGVALREDAGCVAVLQVREGRMVLLPVEIEDAGAVAELLSERRGSRVELRAPKRGEARRLVAMAMENATHHLAAALEREGEARRRGEEAVFDLQKTLGLAVPPRRIEAYDISNLHGKSAVGSMIVFQNGQAKRTDYRRFRIRLSEGEPNDYAMMREVLSRRLAAAVSGNVKFAQLPDLMLIDGGAGQLAVAQQAMESLDLRIPAAGLAKQREFIYLPGVREARSLPAHSRALHLLQQVRDEAHRFALAYHRTLRDREARASVLDGVPGIGEKRKRRLLRRFGSIGRLRQASADEIAGAAGCGRQVAEAVLRTLAASSTE
jgi:excinuclease ABC subunit C